MTAPTFGETIRSLRQAHGLTQQQVADLCGFHYTYISKMENDRLDIPPSDQALNRLARVLEADVKLLYERAGKLDLEALQLMARESPRLCALLRRLPTLTADQIERISEVLE